MYELSMSEKIIVENSAEKIVVKWNGERFALILERKNNSTGCSPSVIILNPAEAMMLLNFLASCGRD